MLENDPGLVPHAHIHHNSRLQGGPRHGIGTLIHPAVATAFTMPLTADKSSSAPVIVTPVPSASVDAGRHRLKPPSRIQTLLSQHWIRLLIFGGIGAGVFLLGLVMQILLVARIHMAADTAYVVQGVVSIETSFLLNRYLTWRDRTVPFWRACRRWNTQRLFMTVVNMGTYAGLVHLGVQYIVANVAITAVFTPVNYLLGHRWSFAASTTDVVEGAAFDPAIPVNLAGAAWPTVSAVIPCKNNAATIGETVAALLKQDYPALEEVILIGSTGDNTWAGLAGLDDSRLVILEQELTSGLRDPAIKRDKGIRAGRGQLIALVDSDIVMDPDWLTRGVITLLAQGGGVVAGGMRSINDTYWGRFVDRNVLVAKTPRVPAPYHVTAENFGRPNRKPPVTANVILTRDVYEDEPLDIAWAFGYEDYEWFWRIARAGHRILFSDQLSGRHHHRCSFRKLVTEYGRAADGCARFIHAHPDSPLARKRRRQAIGLPLIAVVALTAAAAAAATGYALVVAVTIAAGIGVLMAREYRQSRTTESLAYPVAGCVLGVVFTMALVRALASRDTRVRGRTLR